MKPSNPWLSYSSYLPSKPNLFDCLADDHAELPAGAAILHRIAPFIGKVIVVAFFGVVAVLNAKYGWSW